MWGLGRRLSRLWGGLGGFWDEVVLGVEMGLEGERWKSIE
jgi:hypothetical protein